MQAERGERMFPLRRPAPLVVENTRHPILGGGAGASADQMSAAASAAKHEREGGRAGGG